MAMAWSVLLAFLLVLVATLPASTQRAADPFASFLGAVTAANEKPWRAYHDVFNWTHDLPAPFALNGQAYRGSGRLRRVLQRALGGQRVSVGLVGGSISCGHGVQRGVDDWFSRVEAFLRRAFPTATIAARNGCVPAVMSEFVSMCLDKFVEQDVDLMFVEFAVNDGYIDGSVNNTKVASFERLMRKLLRRPRAPAVVLMQFLPTSAKAQAKPFFASIEDHYGVLAQYYGASWLSMRDALWHAHMADLDGFKTDQLLLPDERHPTVLGHKYMADVAVTLLQQTFLDLLLDPHRAEDSFVGGDTAPEPMFPGNYEPENLACATGLDFRAVVVSSEDWYFVNEGTEDKPKWGFVSHVPNATLVLELDTRAHDSLPLPQLTPQQRDSIQQQGWLYGQTADATASAGSAGTHGDAAPGGPGGAASVPPTAAGGATGGEPAWKAASRDAERLAQEAALQAPRAKAPALNDLPPLQLSALDTGAAASPLDAGHRVVGAHGVAVELPADARLPVPDTHYVGVNSAGAGNPGADAAAAHAAAGDAPSGRRRRLTQAAPESMGALPAPLQAAPQRDMVVWVGYMRSYRYMGAARLFCISGCVCEQVYVSGHHDVGTSQTFMARLRASQSPACRVGVQVLQWSQTGRHHKFKVSGVMLSRFVDYGEAIEYGDEVMYAAVEPGAG